MVLQQVKQELSSQLRGCPESGQTGSRSLGLFQLHEVSHGQGRKNGLIGIH